MKALLAAALSIFLMAACPIPAYDLTANLHYMSQFPDFALEVVEPARVRQVLGEAQDEALYLVAVFNGKIWLVEVDGNQCLGRRGTIPLEVAKELIGTES